MVLLLYFWLLWCFSVRFTHPSNFFSFISYTHTLSHTFILSQIFPLQSQTATGSSSLLLIFHVSLFPAESITAGILSHEQTGLSDFASKHFNFTGLIQPWLCSGWVAGVCFGFVWMSACFLDTKYVLSEAWQPKYSIFSNLWDYEAFDSFLNASAAVCVDCTSLVVWVCWKGLPWKRLSLDECL